MTIDKDQILQLLRSREGIKARQRRDRKEAKNAGRDRDRDLAQQVKHKETC